MTKEQRQRNKYIICDTLSAVVSWISLFLFRKVKFEGIQWTDMVHQVLTDPNFWWGVALIPLGWLLLYSLQGTYRNIFRKARLKEFQQTALATILGVIVLFFAFLLDDEIHNYKSYYLAFLFLLIVHFTLTYLLRVMITSSMAKKVHNRQLGFPTLFVGSMDKAYQTYLELENQEIYSGNRFIGFVTLSDRIDSHMSNVMPHLGKVEELITLIDQYQIEEVIIAVEDDEKDSILDVIQTLNRRDDIIIKVTPDRRDLVLGAVKVNSIFHSPLITINNRLMEEWEYSVKRAADILVSLVAMIALSPLYLITAIIVKCTSEGPIFYAQERIGYHGKPFKMHKFRSMYVNAEQAGPALSKDNDPRITPFGRFMRKVRLDEIPQFYNVLRGTMSMVGPRPERQYFIDQIVEKAPEYLMLQKIRPGITSWGQVKYGYAENVDQMVERLRYDLLYLENMSIATDMKILIYTVLIVIQGRGK